MISLSILSRAGIKPARCPAFSARVAETAPYFLAFAESHKAIRGRITIPVGAMIRSILIISLLTVFRANAEEAKMNPAVAEIELHGTLIPKDIYSAFKEMDHMLSPRIKREMASGGEKESAKYYFGLGAWIRNNWVLRSGSDLSGWFNSKGIHHPDDMSGIILESYCRYLRGDPLEYDAIIEYYVRYRKMGEKPVNVPQ